MSKDQLIQELCEELSDGGIRQYPYWQTLLERAVDALQAPGDTNAAAPASPEECGWPVCECALDLANCKAPAASPLQGISWKADGDANFYTLLRGNRWIARIQMNGELLVAQQETILNAMLAESQQARAEPSPSIVISHKQLLEAAHWANPDNDPSYSDSEVGIFYAGERVSEEGEPMAAGLWLYCVDCPEEGVIGPLDGEGFEQAAPQPDRALALNAATIELAAEKLAERFDYPWEYMPEQGRENMRRNVWAVIDAVVSAPRSAGQ